MNILSLFPKSQDGTKYLLAMINDFTKWIECKPLAIVEESHVKNFTFKDIMCHFGGSKTIVTSNRKQFDNGIFEASVKLGPLTDSLISRIHTVQQLGRGNKQNKYWQKSKKLDQEALKYSIIIPN